MKIKFCLKDIKMFFNNGQKEVFFLFFGGHGAKNSGNWLIHHNGNSEYQIHPEEIYIYWRNRE